MSKSDPLENEIDETTGVQTTGHEWDGIKELDNPMPRWWLWSFYACIAFSLGYVIYYPAIPLLQGSTMGISGETTRGLLKQEMQTVEVSRRSKLEKLASIDVTEIAKNEELVRFATAGGSSLYKVYCTQCHGSGASGSPGYPNLNDDDWIWGGDLEAIYTTIAHGARNTEDDDARDSIMPAFGTDGILERPQIAAVAEYVLQLSNQEHDAALAETGKPIYAEQCASCHGENARGLRDVGGPDLADAIWLYGGSRTQIITQISKPKAGVMPPWVDRLGEANVKQLATYVHSLGGGEKTRAE